MIKVAVVEDEENEIAVLGEGLKRYFGECAEEYELSVFRNGMEFLDAFRGGYDIILMDIEMPMLDGFRTAQRIREADDEVSIIFVTILLIQIDDYFGPIYCRLIWNRN